MGQPRIIDLPDGNEIELTGDESPEVVAQIKQKIKQKYYPEMLAQDVDPVESPPEKTLLQRTGTALVDNLGQVVEGVGQSSRGVYKTANGDVVGGSIEGSKGGLNVLGGLAKIPNTLIGGALEAGTYALPSGGLVREGFGTMGRMTDAGYDMLAGALSSAGLRDREGKPVLQNPEVKKALGNVAAISGSIVKKAEVPYNKASFNDALKAVPSAPSTFKRLIKGEKYTAKTLAETLSKKSSELHSEIAKSVNIVGVDDLNKVKSVIPDAIKSVRNVTDINTSSYPQAADIISRIDDAVKSGKGLTPADLDDIYRLRGKASGTDRVVANAVYDSFRKALPNNESIIQIDLAKKTSEAGFTAHAIEKLTAKGKVSDNAQKMLNSKFASKYTDEQIRFLEDVANHKFGEGMEYLTRRAGNFGIPSSGVLALTGKVDLVSATTTAAGLYGAEKLVDTLVNKSSRKRVNRAARGVFKEDQKIITALEEQLAQARKNNTDPLAIKKQTPVAAPQSVFKQESKKPFGKIKDGDKRPETIESIIKKKELSEVNSGNALYQAFKNAKTVKGKKK